LFWLFVATVLLADAQILFGILFLHSNKIQHGDIKLANGLLDLIKKRYKNFMVNQEFMTVNSLLMMMSVIFIFYLLIISFIKKN